MDNGPHYTHESLGLERPVASLIGLLPQACTRGKLESRPLVHRK